MGDVYRCVLVDVGTPERVTDISYAICVWCVHLCVLIAGCAIILMLNNTLCVHSSMFVQL